MHITYREYTNRPADGVCFSNGASYISLNTQCIYPFDIKCVYEKKKEKKNNIILHNTSKRVAHTVVLFRAGTGFRITKRVVYHRLLAFPLVSFHIWQNFIVSFINKNNFQNTPYTINEKQTQLSKQAAENTKIVSNMRCWKKKKNTQILHKTN